MECRDARPLMPRRADLAAAERAQLENHLLSCAACRDEAEDQVGTPWMTLPMAHPPPDLASGIISRLPVTAPVTLARQQRRTRRVIGAAAASALAATMVVGLGGMLLLQSGASHTADLVSTLALPLALIAKALLIVLAQPAIIVSLAVLALLLLLVIARAGEQPALIPRGRLPLALGSGAALIAILALNLSTGRGDLGRIAGSMEVSGPIAGDVATLAGDIMVRGDVDGDVVALAGRVRLATDARVHGSVLSGAGEVVTQDGQVDQHILQAPGVLPALAQVANPQTTPGSIDASASWLGGLIVALVMLLIGLLVAIAWPQIPAESAIQILVRPGRALMLGLLASGTMLVLAAGGSLLLAATVVGVVLVPALLLLLHLPYVAGVAAVGHVLGRRLAGRPTLGGAVWGIVAQAVLVLGSSLLAPSVGLLLFYLLGGLGLGGTLLVWQSNKLEVLL